MQTAATTNRPGQQRFLRPSRQVRDLITDFGRTERRSATLWVGIRPYDLPAYLRHLPVVQEALRWILAISDGGTTVIWRRLDAPARPTSSKVH